MHFQVILLCFGVVFAANVAHAGHWTQVWVEDTTRWVSTDPTTLKPTPTMKTPTPTNPTYYETSPYRTTETPTRYPETTTDRYFTHSTPDYYFTNTPAPTGFEFMFEYYQVIRATEKYINNVEDIIRHLYRTDNDFLSLVKDELNKTETLKSKIIMERDNKLDAGEMYDYFIPELLKHVYRCQKYISLSAQNNGRPSIGGLIVKVEDILERAYRDLGKAEAKNQEISSSFRDNLRDLDRIKESLKTADSNGNGNVAEYIKQIFEIEERIKDEIIKLERLSTLV